MVTQKLLNLVTQCVKHYRSFPFTVSDISISLGTSHSYDKSEIREAIWLLIDRGVVDITHDLRFKLVQAKEG